MNDEGYPMKRLVRSHADSLGHLTRPISIEARFNVD